jgi:hypothetical protein
MKAGITFGFLAALLFLCPQPVCAAVIHVPADQATIQAGIDAALPGDTVLVADGTYKGEGNKNIDFKGKAITVQSDNGPANCIIDCEGDGIGFYFHNSEGTDSVLSGFTITHGEGLGAGILCHSASPKITHCNISYNHSHDGAGISLSNSAPSISFCNFVGNSAYYTSGIYCYSSSPVIENCTFKENISELYGGVICLYGSSPEITNCVISQNNASAILSYDSHPKIMNCTIAFNWGGSYASIYSYSSLTITPMITNSIVWQNSPGQIKADSNSAPTVIYSDVQGGYPGEGNFHGDPLFVDAVNGDYHLSVSSPCMYAGTPLGAPDTDIEGNPRPQGYGYDLGAYQTTGYAEQRPIIDSFIADTTKDFAPFDVAFTCTAHDPDGLIASYRITFGDGSAPQTNTTGVFSHTYDTHGILYAFITVVDDADAAVNSAAIVITNNRKIKVPEDYSTIQAAMDAAIDGDWVLVADGIYTGPGNKDLDFKGKAIVVRSENGPENCMIDCEGNGGAFYFHANEGEDSIVSGFTITNGQTYKGGGVFCDNSSPTIKDCRITNNSATYAGGGIYSFSSSLHISGCEITGNTAQYGGGIYTWGSGTISSCVIRQNSATGKGGGIFCSASPNIMNTIISENSGSEGGGISVRWEGSPSIVNCTITKNVATGTGGAIRVEALTSPVVTNCILWNDGPDEITKDEGSAPSVRYCDVQGGYPGEGNFHGDPLFVDAVKGDYHLSVSSPCMYAGTAEGAPDTDIEGNRRPQGYGFDLGAYETTSYDKKRPIINFVTANVMEAYVPFEVTFSCDAYDPDGEIVSYTVNYGDGSPPETNATGVFKHTYTSVGMGFATYTVTDDTGAAVNSPSRKIVRHGNIYVPADYSTIQAAIDAALDGDSILVADGTYRGDGNKNLDFRGKAITVQSENGPANCIIDCENSGRGFGFHSGEGPNSVLSGFTIMRGQAYGGAGISCENSSPGIANCVITENYGDASGGGGIRVEHGSPTISNCSITRNSTRWFGGGILSYASSPIILDCNITENTAAEGGGIHCVHPGLTNITRCKIGKNRATTGAGVQINSAAATIENSLINNNMGAGISILNPSEANIRSCTIASNSVGVSVGQGTVTIGNSILWGNTIAQLQRVPYQGSITVHHSALDGGWEGNGNLDVAPLFADPAKEDYHLGGQSPCIGAGITAGAPPTDIDGNPRPNPAGSHPDMGAYESPSAIRSAPPLDTFGMGVGNRWSYAGMYQGTSPYVYDEQVVRVDPSSFPVPTYVVEENISGSIYGSWYQALPGELKLWGIQEGGSNNPQKFSSGLTVAWFPMAVGNQRVTDATTIVQGYTINVRMTVNVVGKETVDFGSNSMETYKLSYQLRTWNTTLGYDETESWYYWLAPYVGIIRYEDSESTEVLTSFAIGEGTISDQSDADNDGLKDYREISSGTDWLNMDSDGDGLTDGQEDVNANGIVDPGERDPRIKDPSFGPDSADITHSYCPLAANKKLIYAGTGTYAGFGRYYQVMGTEVVDSVNCLKVNVKGHGKNSNPDLDTEWYTVWLAQDESGVVWVFKHYDALSDTTATLGRVGAVVWAPATFAVGQRFGEIGDTYREVVETGVTVTLGTGLGPYTNCVKVKRVEGTDEDLYYLAGGVGIVKEEWNDGGSTNGWELDEILTGAVADELVMNYGAAYGLWHYAQATSWVQLNTVAPSQMLTADIDNDGLDEVVAGFAGYGLYVYKQGSGWTQINTVLPDVMVKLGKGVAMNFGADYGLWYYDTAGGWQQLNSVPPDQMVAVDIDSDGAEELVAAFAGYGLYTYKQGVGWTQINTVMPDKMIRKGSGLVLDYGVTYGLWTWSQAGGWTQINTVKPGDMTAVDLDNDGAEELAACFAGYGLYKYDETNGWVQLNTVIPDAMRALGKGLVLNFGAAYGLWYYDQVGGYAQWNTVPPDDMVAIDIDKDGTEELVATFAGYGLYVHDEATGWSQLNAVIPDDMMCGNLAN